MCFTVIVEVYYDKNDSVHLKTSVQGGGDYYNSSPWQTNNGKTTKQEREKLKSASRGLALCIVKKSGHIYG